MKKEKIFEAIGALDGALIEESEAYAAIALHRHRMRIRMLSAAACLLVAIAALIAAMPLLRGSEGGGVGASHQMSWKIDGKLFCAEGEAPESSAQASFMSPGFYIRTVVEAEVLEILPEGYYQAGELGFGKRRVARLRVVDVIRGEGVPSEIYLSYGEADHGILEGCETLILSLCQIGIENYTLIGEESGITMFPHMYRAEVGSLGYGSVIAFKDGYVDEAFIEQSKARLPYSFMREHIDALYDDPHKWCTLHGSHTSCFPATRDSSIGEVKAAILANAENAEHRYVYEDCGFVSAEDVFVTEGQKELQSYLAPSEWNVFTHYLMIGDMSITYTRLIGGIQSDETVIVYPKDDTTLFHFRAEKWQTGEGFAHTWDRYTQKEVENAPVLTAIMAAITSDAVQPPFFKPGTAHSLFYFTVCGYYEKVKGDVYGILRPVWYYIDRGDPKRGYYLDYTFLVYGEDMEGREMTKAEMSELVGSGSVIVPSISQYKEGIIANGFLY